MSREIKFRAWDLEKKRWYKASLKKDGWTTHDTSLTLGDYSNGVSPWMQYTGLKDKNGKEIWEGDVLCVYDKAVTPVTDEGQGPIEICNHLVSVEMRNGIWGFEIPRTDDGETGWYGIHYWNTDISSDSYDVIGNIMENPDLIQKI